MASSVSNLSELWEEDCVKQGLNQSSIDLLVSCGYESADAVSTLTEKDIQDLGLPMAQKTILRRWVIKILRSKGESEISVNAFTGCFNETLSEQDEDRSKKNITNVHPIIRTENSLSCESVQASCILSEDSSNDMEGETDKLTDYTANLPPIINSLVKEELISTVKESLDERKPCGISPKDGNSIVMKKQTDVRNTSNCIIADNVHIVRNEFSIKEKAKEEQTLAKNIKGMTKTILKKQQKNILMTTSAFKLAVEILEDLSYVIISGRPGDGKTCIGKKLLSMKAEIGYETYCINSVNSFEKVLDASKHQIFFMDDVFGTVTYDKVRVNEWFHCLENLRCLIDENDGKTLLIFASRNYIIRDIMHLPDKGSFFKVFGIVDLSNEHCLSLDEKEQMTKLYIDEFGLNLSDDEIEYICSLDTSYGFPYALNLFSKSSKLQQLGISFFTNPRERLLSEISGFAREDKIKYCAFVMTSMMENVNISMLDDTCEKTDEQKLVLRVSGISDNTPFKDIIQTFTKLKDIYFQTYDGDLFTFSHETYKEATMASIAETHLKLVLEKFDFDFIVSSTATKTSELDDVNFIRIIPSCYFKVLAQRLIDEYEKFSYNLDSVMKHRCWDDICFITEFDQFVSKHPRFESIIHFMQSKGTLEKTVFFWAIWCKKEMLVSYTMGKCASKSLTHDLSSILKDTPDALIAASYKGLTKECLELLIKYGGDVNAESSFQTYGEDDDGDYKEEFSYYELTFDEYFGHEILVRKMTPVMASIYGNQPRILQFLLSNGARMGVLEDNGRSMIHLAVIQNNSHILKLLLDNPCIEFCASDNKGKTPYHYAKTLNVIKLLYGYHPHLLKLRCSGGNTALHIWARHFPYSRTSVINKEICKWICLKAPQLLNCVNENGLTVLHSVVKSDKGDSLVSEMIELFISYGAKVNISTNTGRTPLHSVARSSNIRSQTASILIKYGIQINARDMMGRTALFYSLFMNNKVFNVLMKAKADPNIKDEYGLPIIHNMLIDTTDPLFHVSSYQFSHECIFDLGIIVQLVENGLDINIKSKKHDDTILHLLLSLKHRLPSYGEVETILKIGANPNIKNKDGNSPTMLAACFGISFLQLLIKYDGDLSLKNCNGETIAHMVLLKTSEEMALSILNFLHEMHVSIQEPDKYRKTPLDITIERQFGSIVQFLFQKENPLHVHQNLLLNAFACKHCSPHFILGIIKEWNITDELWKSKTEDGKSLLMIISENYPSKRLVSLALSKGLHMEDIDKDRKNVCHYLVSGNLDEDELIQRIKDIIEICKPKMLSFLNDEDAIKTAFKCKKYKLLKYMLGIATPITRKSLIDLIPEIIHSTMHGKLLIEIVEILSCQMDVNNFTDAFVEAVKKTRENFVLSFLLSKGSRVKLFSEGESVSYVFGLLGSKCPDSVLKTVFKFLMNNRTLLTITDPHGLNCLQAAIAYEPANITTQNRMDVITFFIEEKINVNHRSKTGDTALHHCISSNRPFDEKHKIIQLLIQSPANVDAKNGEGESVLTNALKSTEKILCSTESLDTLINFSSYNKKYIFTKYLKEYIFSYINFIHPSEKNEKVFSFLNVLLLQLRKSDLVQPLKMSMVKTLPVLTKMCVDLGANVNESGSERKTPLHYLFSSYTIQQERDGMWMCILQHSPSKKDHEFTFKNAFFHHKGLQQLKILLSSGANPNIVNNDGNSPLHLCAKSNFLPIFTHQAMCILLKYGSDINQRNKENMTPLLLAIQNYGNRDRIVRIIELLKNKNNELFGNMHTVDTYLQASKEGIREAVMINQKAKTFGCSTEMFDFYTRWYINSGYESD